MNHTRYLFNISYDGSNYHGFQKQLKNKTIQSEIERALKYMVKSKLNIHASGRTDKGVHAISQMFHVDLPFLINNKDVWIHGLNKRLPEDIIINDIIKVDNDFHARYSAKYRVYKYVISKTPSTVFMQRYEVYIKDFDVKLAKKAAKLFVGIKDYKGFSKTNGEIKTIRTINDLTINETNTHIYITIKGVSFLRYMVRSIVGTIIDVATNKLDINIINEIFKTNNRKLAGKTAKAKALFLKEIIY